jgi:hypothetical protein
MSERDPSTQQTAPGLDLVTGPSATGAGAYGATGGYPSTTPDYSDRPVAVRGPESLGGLLLILAGIAAGISLALGWVAGTGDTGWRLVRRGLDELDTGVSGLLDTGWWQPLAVVLGGGVLFVLGILLWLPARTHRLLGLLGLLVSGLALAAVVVPLTAENWRPSAFELGFWFACAVGVLGVLGSLKALLTGRRYR